MSEDLNPTLRGKRVSLRRLHEDDLGKVVDFFARNRDHLQPTSPIVPDNLCSREYWLARKAELDQLASADRAFHFWVTEDERDRIVGYVNFSNIVRGAFHACHLGYAIDRQVEGKGYMSESLRLGIGFMFGGRHLHRIMANYLPDNTRSAVLLARLGFVAEGYARRYLRIAGEWQDHVMTSLINDSWQGGPAGP